MKFTEFLLLVAQMREAQRAFYTNRTQSSLIDAKTREAAVDGAIKQATAEISEFEDYRQAELFADEAIRTVAQRHTAPRSPSIDDRLERSHD